MGTNTFVPVVCLGFNCTLISFNSSGWPRNTLIHPLTNEGKGNDIPLVYCLPPAISLQDSSFFLVFKPPTRPLTPMPALEEQQGKTCYRIKDSNEGNADFSFKKMMSLLGTSTQPIASPILWPGSRSQVPNFLRSKVKHWETSSYSSL